MHMIENIVRILMSYIRPDMTSEEVEAVMTELAARHSEKLDWKHSIVDLLKLVNLPSGLKARKKLATELGYTGKLDGSAEMNTWLASEVLKKIRHHGIPIPA